MMNGPEIDPVLVRARRDRIPVMALRHDSDGLDDVVVETPRMFRAEMMSDDHLWMCCYFGDNHERVAFAVTAVTDGRKATLQFSVTEEPAEWLDWDKLREGQASDPSRERTVTDDFDVLLAYVHEILADLDAARAEIERLRQGLWDCARESGADMDGQETPAALRSPDIVAYALEEVRQLHKDYDEALDA